MQAALLQVEQMHAPGVCVAMVFKAQQVAITRQSIDTDEYRLTILENFVVGTDMDSAEILLAIDLACQVDRCPNDVVDRPQRDVVVEKIAEKFDDSAQGTVTDQHQTEDQLTQPMFGDRQLKEYLVVIGERLKSTVEGFVRDGLLLVNEFAADLRLLG